MSMNNLSINGEFRYIIQWFNEWSELQRDDFIPVLVDCLNQDVPDVYMNGVVSAVANAGVADRPMSLFQCRIKLFREWTPKWTTELRHQLKDKIIEIDSKVGEKIINEIKGNSEAHANGPSAMTEDDTVVHSESISEVVVVVEGDNNEDHRLTPTAVNNEAVEATALNTSVVAVTEGVNSAHKEPEEQVLIPTSEEFVVAPVAQTVSNNAEV